MKQPVSFQTNQNEIRGKHNVNGDIGLKSSCIHEGDTVCNRNQNNFQYSDVVLCTKHNHAIMRYV